MAARGECGGRGRPAIRTCPVELGSRPKRASRSSERPEPTKPPMPRISPGRIEREIPWSLPGEEIWRASRRGSWPLGPGDGAGARALRAEASREAPEEAPTSEAEVGGTAEPEVGRAA